MPIYDTQNPTSYSLIFEFDTDNPEFVRGFELGKLYQVLDSVPLEYKETLHSTNMEMIRRLAIIKKYDIEIYQEVNDWIEVTFTFNPTKVEDKTSIN